MGQEDLCTGCVCWKMTWKQAGKKCPSNVGWSLLDFVQTRVGNPWKIYKSWERWCWQQCREQDGNEKWDGSKVNIRSSQSGVEPLGFVTWALEENMMFIKYEVTHLLGCERDWASSVPCFVFLHLTYEWAHWMPFFFVFICLSLGPLQFHPW